RDNTRLADGTENTDGMDRLQAGFRTDWAKGVDGYTVQGDVYGAEDNQEPEAQELRGGNLLGRGTREVGGGDSLRVQVYYDYTSREQQRLDTADLEFGHALRARGSHR